MNATLPFLDRMAASVDVNGFAGRLGKVAGMSGLAIEVTGLGASVGDVCEVSTAAGSLPAEVVGFRDSRLLVMPLGEVVGVRPGAPVRPTGRPHLIGVGRALLGRVVDAFGRPLDGGPPLAGVRPRPIHGVPPSVMDRHRITDRLETGIRAIDAILPLGQGQRVGIFAGSGVGKSYLLGMLASHARADVNVVALIGERGREVREFVERDLGVDGLARSVVVVATSNEPALVRRQAAFAAMAVAESFRDEGATVLVMMDSVTRFAMAQREIALAVGEPPATRGYPPSVFALMPRLLERAGTTPHRGSITGLYTVLVEGDDMNDPVGDTVRAILDGHIVLSRELASANHYPAIDVLGSVSRLAGDLTSREERAAAGRVRERLATWRDVRDLVAIGAYVRGSDPRADAALAVLPAINAFLRQSRGEHSSLRETTTRLATLVAPLEGER